MTTLPPVLTFICPLASRLVSQPVLCIPQSRLQVLAGTFRNNWDGFTKNFCSFKD